MEDEVRKVIYKYRDLLAQDKVQEFLDEVWNDAPHVIDDIIKLLKQAGVIDNKDALLYDIDPTNEIQYMCRQLGVKHNPLTYEIYSDRILDIRTNSFVQCNDSMLKSNFRELVKTMLKKNKDIQSEEERSELYAKADLDPFI